MSLTQTMLLFVVALLVIWDIGAVIAGGYQATISAVVLVWAKRWPIVPFGLGVVIGHILWLNAP